MILARDGRHGHPFDHYTIDFKALVTGLGLVNME
jgi:hypothetical protein